MLIEILFKMVLFKGGVLIYAEHCISNQQTFYPGDWALTIGTFIEEHSHRTQSI